MKVLVVHATVGDGVETLERGKRHAILVLQEGKGSEKEDVNACVSELSGRGWVHVEVQSLAEASEQALLDGEKQGQASISQAYRLAKQSGFAYVVYGKPVTNVGHA